MAKHNDNQEKMEKIEKWQSVVKLEKPRFQNVTS